MVASRLVGARGCTERSLPEIVVRRRYSPVVDDDLKDGLIWWSTDRATVGLVVRDGVVVETAPYARFCLRSTVPRVGSGSEGGLQLGAVLE